MIPATISVGDSWPLLSLNCINGCNWSSLNPAIAKITGGEVVGVAEGTVTVTATSLDTKAVVDTLQVIVLPNLPSVLVQANKLGNIAIAGIVVGSVVVVVAIVLGLYFGLKNKKSKSAAK